MHGLVADLFDELLLDLIELFLRDAAFVQPRVLPLESILRGALAFVEYGIGRLNVIGCNVGRS